MKERVEKFVATMLVISLVLLLYLGLSIFINDSIYFGENLNFSETNNENGGSGGYILTEVLVIAFSTIVHIVWMLFLGAAVNYEYDKHR